MKLQYQSLEYDKRNKLYYIKEESKMMKIYFILKESRILVIQNGSLIIY